MSNTPTISHSPEALPPTPSRNPAPPQPEVLAALAETTQRLRAELAATPDRARQARLLHEIADLEERGGDEPAAARDYLGAYNADSTFREPLEGLVRLLEKRRSLKNLGKLIDALTRVAAVPDERVRSLLMRATYQADVANDLPDAKSLARDAVEVEGASAAELSSAWLSLEVLSGRTGDTGTREEALSRRAGFASSPTWKALLLLDRARLAAAAGEVDAALTRVEEARALGSEATWTATALLEQIAHDHPATAGTDEARARAETHAAALEATATLIDEAMTDAARGDALGVPHWVRQPARQLDAWLRAAETRRQLGQLEPSGAMLDRALGLVATLPSQEAPLAEATVTSARIRVAEQMGDKATGARLAEQRLATEKHGGLVAALALRVAENAAAQGDTDRALEAVSRAIASDPGSLPARVLQLDMLADGADPAAFAAQLESFADHLATDEARGRAFLLAAHIWAVRANDVAGAKAALSQAAMYGVAPSTIGRVARGLASVAGDAAWYEDATKRLVAAGGTDTEAVSLYVELLRLRQARSDVDGTARALRDMASAPGGAWLARVLEAFLPQSAHAADPHAERTVSRARAAIEELASLETDPDWVRGLSLVAALRALAEGDVAAARKKAREIVERDASDTLAATLLANLDREAGDHSAAASAASDAAASTDDGELAAALHLEAGLERWHAGDRKAAVEEFEAALARAPDAGNLLLAWAARGIDVDSAEGRRRAIERSLAAGGGDGRALALERFATEVGGGDPDDAAEALASIDRDPEGNLGLAAALGRLAWSAGAANADATREAVARVAASGPRGLLLATAEQVRIAREAQDAEEIARAASRWFDAGGGLAAAIEWLAAAGSLGQPEEEKVARLATAAALSGEAREAMQASAALLEPRIHPFAPAPLVTGESASVRLANLELSPPGCDPRRRRSVLIELGTALGDDAAIDAASLAGWSALTANDLEVARAAFETAVTARPTDLAAWEGLRACGEQSGDRDLQARAAAEVGARCVDPVRGAAFWEEAALLWLALGDDANADRALEGSFARSARQAVAFDKLFRRVRDRKDNDRLLGLIGRRLEVTDEPQEIQKLFWEQARVLRDKGNQEGALNALEHVTMLDPDHVGALALVGEINIRRGNFEDAATSLARLATLDTAPAKNRLTAGIAAVDLYEKKLERFDKALEVLLGLHQAKLSSLPVRERLARAAARTGSWTEATAILEELMHERPEPAGRIEAARLAMAIHRDRLDEPQGAAAAIVKLLEESPIDGEALDLFLQTDHPREIRDHLLKSARVGLIEALQKQPTDVLNVRRLVKVARALGDDALHQAALAALLSLDGGDAQSEQAFTLIASKKVRVPQISISEPLLRSILAPGDEGPIADLFVALGPTLAEALGPSLQACGVTRKDKVDPRSGLALRNEIASWAGAFGIHEFDLYVGGNDPQAVQGIPGEPPAIVVGSGINAPLSPTARARIAREILAIVRGTTVTRSRDETTILAIVASACKQAEVPIEHPPYAVLAEVSRLIGKAISRKTRKAIVDTCRNVVRTNADGRGWTRRALASHDRIAAIASGDPRVALVDVSPGSSAVSGNARVEELLRFVLSPRYLEIRRSLGLEGGT